MLNQYRDPVSQLAIVPLETIDCVARAAFRRLLMLLPSDPVVPVILYYSSVERCTRRGKSVSRYLLISPTHWYIYKPTGELTRCSRIDRISRVILCRDAYMVWKMQQERDVVMRLGDVSEVGFVINILSILRPSHEGSTPLGKTRDEHYTNLREDDMVELERTTKDDDVEWPLPLLLSSEAQQPCSVEDMMLLMPPPAARVKSSAGELNGVLPELGISETTRIDAILKYLNGEIESPPTPVVPVNNATVNTNNNSIPSAPIDNAGSTSLSPTSAAASGNNGDNAGAFPLVGQTHVSVPKESDNMSATSTQNSTIRRVERVQSPSSLSVAAAVPSNTTQSSPLPRAVPTPITLTSRPPPQHPLFMSTSVGNEGRSATEISSLLRELREMENRMVSLERISQSQQCSHSHFNTVAGSQKNIFTEKTESLSSLRSLPPRPFVRLVPTHPPPRISSQQEVSTGMSAVSFERLIASNTCEERRLLRGYEIERKLAQVSEYRKGNDTSKFLLVGRLQEELLLLLRAQEIEQKRELGEEKKRKEKDGETNSAHASIGSGMDTSASAESTLTDSELNDDERDDEKTHCAATMQWKQWLEDHLAEHLNACKEKMVQDIFSGPNTSFS